MSDVFVVGIDMIKFGPLSGNARCPVWRRKQPCWRWTTPA